MSLNTILIIRTREIGGQKSRKMWKSAWRRALEKKQNVRWKKKNKTLRPRNKWRRQWFDRGTVMTSPKFQTRILHFKPFGQDF